MEQKNIPVKTLMEELGMKHQAQSEHGGVGIVTARITDWINWLENSMLATIKNIS